MLKLKRRSIEDLRSLPDICGSCNFATRISEGWGLELSSLDDSEATRLGITNTSYHFDSLRDQLYLEYYVVSDKNEKLQQFMAYDATTVDVFVFSPAGELIFKHVFETQKFTPVGDVSGSTENDVPVDPIKIKLCANVSNYCLFNFNVGEDA